MGEAAKGMPCEGVMSDAEAAGRTKWSAELWTKNDASRFISMKKSKSYERSRSALWMTAALVVDVGFQKRGGTIVPCFS